MRDTKMPTIEAMKKEVAKGTGNTYRYTASPGRRIDAFEQQVTRLKKQRNNLHAIAAELEAKLSRIDFALRHRPTGLTVVGQNAIDVWGEELIQILEKENTDGDD